MAGFGDHKKSHKKIKKNLNQNYFREQIIQSAFKFHAEGNITEAIKYYKSFINQGFEDKRVFCNFGILLIGLGKLKEAELSLRKAIELNPNYADAHMNLGGVFKDLGKLKEAELSLRKAVELNPNYAIAHSNLGLIFRDLGKLKEAELSLRKAIELNPNYAIAHSNLGPIIRDLGKLEEAELSLRKAIELNPNYANAHSNLGVIFRDLGKLEDAELSYRKAIELNPDYANAHSNLGNTLRDLGKLEELLVFSKLTVESRTINQGYKLVAALNITIGNLLKGDFSELLFSLNKTNELINKGALDIIKNKKNKKHSLTYFQFINALYPLLDKETQSLEKIPHIGESHCLSFAHQTISLSSKVKVIQPVLITGAKAWHFANNKNNQWKSSLKKQIKNHNYSDEVFISFGEIDCRKAEGILIYAKKQNQDISEVCKKTIKGYLDYMEKILSSEYSRRYYFGIPAPTRSQKLLDEFDKKRVELIKKYNSFLKKEVLSRNSYFLDVYSLTSNKDGENNNLHMCDKTHLSPKCLSKLFEDYLHKPVNIIQ